MPELGIAVVHYHAEKLLVGSLAALAGSTFGDFTAVVVDNGSRTDLRGLVADSADSRFRVIDPGRNLGFAAGTNLALRHLPSSASYVLLINPDVVVEPRTLEDTLSPLLERSNAGAATCRLRLPSGDLDPACRRSEPTPWTALAKQLGLQRLAPKSTLVGRYNLTYLDPDLPHEVDAASGAFLLIRRRAFEQAGCFLDERFFLYGEDLDLCRRLRQAGYRVLYWPGATALHVKGSGRVRGVATTFHFYRAMWLYYRKWGRSRGNPLVLAPLLLALATLGTVEAARNQASRLFPPRALQRPRR